MKRTVLYYPNIQIPTDGSWIRQALLYWDQVAAIVSRSYDGFMDQYGLERYPLKVQELLHSNVFRPIDPQSLFHGSFRRDFETDVKEYIRSRRGDMLPDTVRWSDIYRDKMDRLDPAGKFTWDEMPRKIQARIEHEAVTDGHTIYRDKASDHIFRLFHEVGLALDCGHKLFYYFEQDAARAYMALLAKHLANADSHLTVPGTDEGKASKLAFGVRGGDEGIVGYSAWLRGVLPVPAPDVPLAKILEFKRTYKAELDAFRAEMEAFEKSLANESIPKRAAKLAQAQKEKIERECILLAKALRGARVSMSLGSLQAFIKPNSPTLVGSAVVIAGKATTLTTIPIEYVVAGATLAGTIEVAMHLFNTAKEYSETLSNSAFAYVFHAQRKWGKK